MAKFRCRGCDHVQEARWFGPCAEFLPDGATRTPTDSWWRLTPALVVRMLGVLGFNLLGDGLRDALDPRLKS